MTGQSRILKLAEFFLLLAFLACSGNADANEKPYYVGSEACKVCHEKEYISWQQTRMYKSFEALLPMTYPEEKKLAGLETSRDYTVNQNCLACHTTGFVSTGSKGGYDPILNNDRTLRNVGCEMCHGPGSKYVKLKIGKPEYERLELQKAGLVLQTRETCLQCHNDSGHILKDSGFNFEKMVKQGVHEIYELKYNH